MGSQVIGRGLGKENNIGRGPDNELGGGGGGGGGGGHIWNHSFKMGCVMRLHPQSR